jgi:phosphosulfolactate synthase (CoM biosynthesis protein A)
VRQFARWAGTTGIEAVEVSNGLGLMDRSAKRRLIRALADEFVVLAETGRKDPRSALEMTNATFPQLADLSNRSVRRS